MNIMIFHKNNELLEHEFSGRLQRPCPFTESLYHFYRGKCVVRSIVVFRDRYTI